MKSFCKYLEEIKANCTSCMENHIGACHYKLGLQDYFGEEFQLYDTIVILKHDHKISVETDIEVTYNTKYPYGGQAGKGMEFAEEYDKKEKAMRSIVEPQLPSGVKLLGSHQHYTPDKHDPNRVAIHIHAYKKVEDLDEAKLVASKMIEAIRPSKIGESLKEA